MSDIDDIIYELQRRGHIKKKTEKTESGDSEPYARCRNCRAAIWSPNDIVEGFAGSWHCPWCDYGADTKFGVFQRNPNYRPR